MAMNSSTQSGSGNVHSPAWKCFKRLKSHHVELPCTATLTAVRRWHLCAPVSRATVAFTQPQQQPGGQKQQELEEPPEALL